MTRRHRPQSLGTNVAAAPPSFIAPCLATAVSAPPAGPDWGHEIKFDGYRIQVRLVGDEIRLLTRTGLDWTQRFGKLSNAFRHLGVDSAIIDGEAIVEDPRGVSSFADLVEALKSSQSARIAYVAFDLLFVDGVSLVDLPLAERKARLASIMARARTDTQLRFSEHIVGDADVMMAEACRLGLEGLVSKRLDKPYRSGRHDDWRKAKCVQSDEFVVVGYLDSRATREAIGALVLAAYDESGLRYTGRVGTGFSQRTAGDIWDAMQPLRRATSPLSEKLDAQQARGVIWVEPELVAQVTYRAVTQARLLRHASFTAIRGDVPANTVGIPKAWS